MTRKLILLSYLALIFFVQAGFAQTFNKAKMDSLFDALGVNNKAMMSIAITKKGQPLYSRAIGYSWYAPAKTPANTKTKYRIGSISKVFTATMIFQLIEAGKLQLTTPLAQFYPQLPNAGKITIAHMLNHSSGLHSFTNDSDFTSWLSQKQTQAQLLAKINVKPGFEPGAKHQYSNPNFILLGYIVEILDKKPYAVSLKERITSKIGLKDTYYGGKIIAANNEANSYTWQGDWKPEVETDMSIPAGAGALVATPNDLVKFMEALFAGKLISQASLTQMRTIKNGFGMNLFPYNFGNHKSLGHTGGIDGFKSQAVYFPEEDIAVAFVANGINTSLNNILNGAVKIVFNEPFVVPSYKTFTVKSEELNKYLGVYASTQIPLKIAITKKDAVLMGQATGQPSFVLDAVAANEFAIEAVDAQITFDPANSQMTLKQGGGTFLFTKEK
jgi:CubicO group peptidase (beta-lactamase class C family)